MASTAHSPRVRQAPDGRLPRRATVVGWISLVLSLVLLVVGIACVAAGYFSPISLIPAAIWALIAVFTIRQ